MSSLDLSSMQDYLSRSISRVNENKIRGLIAEVSFRTYLQTLNFADRVSVGGWIARITEENSFATQTAVFFPETISPTSTYPVGRTPPAPTNGLHTICSTFHQIGVKSYFCAPQIAVPNDADSIEWNCIQLGVPTQQSYAPFPSSLTGFHPRTRKQGFLKKKGKEQDVSGIPANSVPEEFTKEHLRVTFQSRFFSEISDVDGILWGNTHTYPLEIKEKTPAKEDRIGAYFGLDIGPFVKLAFYAAKRGNLKSLFIVREIDNVTERNLVAWQYITFEQLAQVASWNQRSGGKGMNGGASSTVRIPKSEFSELNAAALASL